MGEVLYRWLFVKRQERVPGAFLFSNRHRTGLKTGGQLPGLVFPDDDNKSRFRIQKNRAGFSIKPTVLIIEYQRNEKRWQCLLSVGGINL